MPWTKGTSIVKDSQQRKEKIDFDLDRVCGIDAVECGCGCLPAFGACYGTAVLDHSYNSEAEKNEGGLQSNNILIDGAGSWVRYLTRRR